MNTKTPKFKKLNLLQSKWKILTVILLCFSFTSLIGQTYQPLGDGEYKFNSYFPEWDLHFWVFEDGYHSFEHHPTHHYGTNVIPSYPKLFHAKPYDDDDDVIIFPAGIISSGSSDPDPTIIHFENKIEIKRSWNLVEDNDNFFILMFENNTPTAHSGCVEFHFNSNDINIDPSKILDDFNNDWVGDISIKPSGYSEYTHKFSWPYSNLEPNEQRFIYIPADCLKDALSTVYTRGVMKTSECDNTLPLPGKDNPDGANSGVYNSQLYTLKSKVSNFPHDPNYINTDPNCWTDVDAYLTRNFTYKLYFQNEGVDLSEDVNIDFLGNTLISSVELVESSNNCILYWDGHGINVFFDGIDIRGLNEDPEPPSYESTIGWVEFDVCYNLEDIGINNMHCIDLDAYVEFDGQLPIIAYSSICKPTADVRCETDYTHSTLGLCVPAPAYQSSTDVLINGLKTATSIVDASEEIFELSPSPAENFIIIKTTSFDESMKFSVTNTLGEIIMTGDLNEIDGNLIDVSKLNSGLYFFTLLSEEKKESKSFIKI